MQLLHFAAILWSAGEYFTPAEGVLGPAPEPSAACSKGDYFLYSSFGVKASLQCGNSTHIAQQCAQTCALARISNGGGVCTGCDLQSDMAAHNCTVKWLNGSSIICGPMSQTQKRPAGRQSGGTSGNNNNAINSGRHTEEFGGWSGPASVGSTVPGAGGSWAPLSRGYSTTGSATHANSSKEQDAGSALSPVHSYSLGVPAPSQTCNGGVNCTTKTGEQQGRKLLRQLQAQAPSNVTGNVFLDPALAPAPSMAQEIVKCAAGIAIARPYESFAWCAVECAELGGADESWVILPCCTSFIYSCVGEQYCYGLPRCLYT